MNVAVQSAAAAAELNRSIAESSTSIEHMLLMEGNSGGSSGGAVGSSDARLQLQLHSSSLQAKHEQSYTINSHYERTTYERDAKLSGISNELAASNMRLQEVTAHKQRLLEQVQLCDQELGNLSSRIGALNTDLSNSRYYYQQQLEQLAQTGG